MLPGIIFNKLLNRKLQFVTLQMMKQGSGNLSPFTQLENT